MKHLGYYFSTTNTINMGIAMKPGHTNVSWIHRIKYGMLRESGHNCYIISRLGHKQPALE